MDSKKLKKIAHSARIEVKKEDEEKLINLLNSDINTVKSIEKIDTENILASPNPYEMFLDSYLDIISDGDKQEELMKYSASAMYNYFSVPKILEN